MTTSATGIWIIIAVTVAGLAIFLGSVVLAARQPRRRHAQGERLRGTVQGGMTSAPAAASHRDATSRWDPKTPPPGTRSPWARNPGTPGGARGAR